MAEVKQLSDKEVIEIFMRQDKEALVNLLVAADKRIRDLQAEIKKIESSR